MICILSEPSGKLRAPEPSEFRGPPLVGKGQVWRPAPTACGFGLYPEPEAARVLRVSRETLTSESLKESRLAVHFCLISSNCS